MLTTASEQIKHGMALAFFAMAFSELREEEGDPMTGEVFDQLPDIIDPAALMASEALVQGLIDCNPKASAVFALAGIYKVACDIFNADPCEADRELSPELFGHYCAMQAMGSGVGLESFGNAVRDAIVVPNVEFGFYSLQYDYD